MEHFKKLRIGGMRIPKKYGGQDYNLSDYASIMFELARHDGSMFTFVGVHNGLGGRMIGFLGDEEQQARFLPGCASFDKVSSFALTEPNYGSDATSLEANVVKTEGGYILNGVKRWIGNGTFADYICVWARNLDDKKLVQGFVVEKGMKGLTTTKIEGKMALRMVQNADITFDNVFIPQKNKLAYALNFDKSANVVLNESRVGVAYQCAGLAVGAYETSLKYCLERKQFNRPLASFQLV